HCRAAIAAGKSCVGLFVLLVEVLRLELGVCRLGLGGSPSSLNSSPSISPSISLSLSRSSSHSGTAVLLRPRIRLAGDGLHRPQSFAVSLVVFVDPQAESMHLRFRLLCLLCLLCLLRLLLLQQVARAPLMKSLMMMVVVN